MNSQPREIHPGGCFCPTCFPINGNSVQILAATWRDVRDAVTDPTLNKSGEEFELSTTKDGKFIIAQLVSQRHVQEDLKSFWMWKKETPDNATKTD
jgi:hypothetical protein